MQLKYASVSLRAISGVGAPLLADRLTDRNDDVEFDMGWKDVGRSVGLQLLVSSLFNELSWRDDYGISDLVM
jgi:hypothetical protein